MNLNLNTILDRPGAKLDFESSFDFSTLGLPQIARFLEDVFVSGTVQNIAGALTLKGELSLSAEFICDRCTKEFPWAYTLPVVAHLAEHITEEDNPDLFLLEGGAAPIEEIFITAFLLELDGKTVCQEECAGLCSTCGFDLNDGPCTCPREVDSRLSALGQLLEE